MPLHRLHLVDLDGLHAYRREGGKLLLEDRFAYGEDGATAFTHWLQQGRNGGVHTLLVDLPDEGFHFELIPHVGGADRKALLARKLAQHFFGSPLSTVISLGREKEGRRDERVLFAGINRPAAVESWLQAIADANVPLRSVLTPPLLLKPLLAALPPKSERGLIIALTPGGIRQIFFDEGKLRFARLTPPPAGSLADWGPDCLREANKTYQYITGQRWIQRNSPLNVWLVCANAEAPALIPHLSGGEPLEFHRLSLESLHKQFSVPDAVSDSNCRALLLRLALLASPEPQLAAPELRRIFRLWQVRRAVTTLAAAVFVVCGLLAAKAWFEASSLRADIAAVREDSVREDKRYQDLLTSLPRMPAPLETLLPLSASYDQLNIARSGPRALMSALSQSLQQFPEIELHKLDWRAHEHTFATERIGNGPAQALPSSALVTASLAASSASDPRLAVERIQALMDDLQQRGGLATSDLQQPFEVDSDRTLRNTRPGAAGNRIEFSFRITQREAKRP